MSDRATDFMLREGMRALAEQGDLFTTQRHLGDAGAERGMKTAADHAERKSPGWGTLAIAMVRRYLAEHPPRWRFIAPELRAWARQHGLPDPPSNLAWGSILSRAARERLIVSDGYEQYGDGKMHTQSVRAWRKSC